MLRNNRARASENKRGIRRETSWTKHMKGALLHFSCNFTLQSWPQPCQVSSTQSCCFPTPPLIAASPGSAGRQVAAGYSLLRCWSSASSEEARKPACSGLTAEATTSRCAADTIECSTVPETAKLMLGIICPRRRAALDATNPSTGTLRAWSLFTTVPSDQAHCFCAEH